MTKKLVVSAVVLVLVLVGIYFLAGTTDKIGENVAGSISSASISSGEAVVKEVRKNNIIVAEFVVKINGKTEKLTREVDISGALIPVEKDEKAYQQELQAYEEMMKSYEPDAAHPGDRPVPPERTNPRKVSTEDLKIGTKAFFEVREDLRENERVSAVTVRLL
ncbi:MAG TPA: hypothetical protein VNK70_00750 [Candidatus Paceibacterota bacterium]|nr:hypothetical protein [Candidatus Paceibacterota bacterium]